MDNDLISRSALLEKIDQYMKDAYDCPLNEVEEFQASRMRTDIKAVYNVNGLYEATELIDDIPAVDALLIPEEVDGKAVKFIWQKQDGTLVSYAPVVRCKDCESFGVYQCSGNGYCRHAKGLIDPNPEDFCSYGEKRNGEYD